MAKYSSLSIYKVTRPWVAKIYEVTTSFNRTYKYSLGTDIRRHAVDFLAQIHKANINKENRLNELKNMIFIFERLHIELEIAYDLKLIGKRQYFDLFMPLKEIQEQMHKWKKYVERSTNSNFFEKENDNLDFLENW